ncbi:hypothetical protein [Burkholderia singularis]|uniref:hypothetical protein n=1 Tax=Burkholderia singularis TaxID=1503053 RepID=UPI002114CA05|nr:hypothetical protein [Burkholderia singularis]
MAQIAVTLNDVDVRLPTHDDRADLADRRTRYGRPGSSDDHRHGDIGTSRRGGRHEKRADCGTQRQRAHPFFHIAERCFFISTILVDENVHGCLAIRILHHVSPKGPDIGSGKVLIHIVVPD